MKVGEVGDGLSSLPRPTNLAFILRWNDTHVENTTLYIKPPCLNTKYGNDSSLIEQRDQI